MEETIQETEVTRGTGTKKFNDTRNALSKREDIIEYTENCH